MVHGILPVKRKRVEGEGGRTEEVEEEREGEASDEEERNMSEVEGGQAPEGVPEREEEEEEQGLREVPDVFESVEEYVSVFESLLLEEFRAQIVRGSEETGGHGLERVRLGVRACVMFLVW